MPLALSTKFTARVALPCDNSNLKEASRFAEPAPTDPQFEVRFLTPLQIGEISQALETRDKESFDEWRARAQAAIAPYIVATHNMSGGTLADLLDQEVEELAIQMILNSRLGYYLAKKYNLPRSSGAAASAASAAAENAAALPASLLLNPSTARTAPLRAMNPAASAADGASGF